MMEAIRRALHFSPSHASLLEQAIAGIPDQELPAVAATLGKTAKAIGLTELPNPFNAVSHPQERAAYDRWFKSGFERGQVPPMAGADTVVNLTTDLAAARSSLVFANQRADQIAEDLDKAKTDLATMTTAHDAAVKALADSDAKNVELGANLKTAEGVIDELNAKIATLTPKEGTTPAAEGQQSAEKSA